MEFVAGEVPEQHVIRPATRNKSSLWSNNLISIPASRTLKRVSAHLCAIIATACMVCACQQLWPARMAILLAGLDTSMHSLVGGALGLLLVFRTNSAYDRFWEARKIWSMMISTIRDFSRLAHSSLQGWDREHILQLLAALPPILLQHLRQGRAGGSDIQKDALRQLLSDTDVEIIWTSRHRPLAIVRMLAAIVQVAMTDSQCVMQRYAERYGKGGLTGADLSVFEINLIMGDIKANRALAEKCLETLTVTISNSERIVKTAVPQAYSKHTSRFLSVWSFSLPLVLVVRLGWAMIPCVAAICWALLCIEEVGNMIEDPFNMPFLFKDSPYRDELELERSFKNIRGDIFDRSPAAVWSDLPSDNLCFTDYDVSMFHRTQVPAYRLSLSSPASISSASQQLLYEGAPTPPSVELRRSSMT
jgi:putative membrane protein